MEGDPLTTLRDIQVPPPPDGFSLLPVLAGVGAILCFLILLALLVARLRNRWSSEVANALHPTRLGSDPLTEAARLLRQAALKRSGPRVARQQGDAWLASLDRVFRTRFFTIGAGRIFADGLYKQQPLADDVLPRLRRIAQRRAWLP